MAPPVCAPWQGVVAWWATIWRCRPHWPRASLLPAPGRRRIKRMMRVGHRHPGAKRLRVRLSNGRFSLAPPLRRDVLDRAVPHPRAVVPRRGQGAVVRLGSDRLGIKSLAVKGVFHPAQAIPVIPALVVQATRAGLGKPVVMPQLHQLDLLKAHVRAFPIVCKQMRTGNVLAAAGWSVCVGVIARKMRLANEPRVVARFAQ